MTDSYQHYGWLNNLRFSRIRMKLFPMNAIALVILIRFEISADSLT
jgi:hypothetical protein